MLKFCVLASGSKGNAIYVSVGKTHVLVDVGLPLKELKNRLKAISVEWESIDAILITHEHMDHIRALKDMSNTDAPVIYTSRLTYKAINRKSRNHKSFQIFETLKEFTIGDFTIKPFSVMHDSTDPVGFRIQTESCKIGIALDLGCLTQTVLENLRNVNILVIESNHDVELLAKSKRPSYLKKRIMGNFGHLSNEECAHIIEKVLHKELYYVFLVHLSQECNDSKRALAVNHDVVMQNGYPHVSLNATFQDRVSRCIELEADGTAVGGYGAVRVLEEQI